MITDRALLGLGDPARSVFEPARVPGHGSVPAPVARARLRDGLDRSGGPPRRPGRGVGAAAVHDPGRAGPGRDGLPASGVRRAAAPDAGAARRRVLHPLVRGAHRARRPHHPGARWGPHRLGQRRRQVRPLQPGQGGPRLGGAGDSHPGDRGLPRAVAGVPRAAADSMPSRPTSAVREYHANGDRRRHRDVATRSPGPTSTARARGHHPDRAPLPQPRTTTDRVGLAAHPPTEATPHGIPTRATPGRPARRSLTGRAAPRPLSRRRRTRPRPAGPGPRW